MPCHRLLSVVIVAAVVVAAGFFILLFVCLIIIIASCCIFPLRLMIGIIVVHRHRANGAATTLLPELRAYAMRVAAASHRERNYAR